MSKLPSPWLWKRDLLAIGRPGRIERIERVARQPLLPTPVGIHDVERPAARLAARASDESDLQPLRRGRKAWGRERWGRTLRLLVNAALEDGKQCDSA